MRLRAALPDWRRHPALLAVVLQALVFAAGAGLGMAFLPALRPIPLHSLRHFLTRGAVHRLAAPAFRRHPSLRVFVWIDTLQRIDNPLDSISLLHQFEDNSIEIH